MEVDQVHLLEPVFVETCGASGRRSLIRNSDDLGVPSRREMTDHSAKPHGKMVNAHDLIQPVIIH